MERRKEISEEQARFLLKAQNFFVSSVFVLVIIVLVVFVDVR